jgi:protein tyrosine/serine phosphatase
MSDGFVFSARKQIVIISSMKHSWLRFLLGIAILALIVGGPFAYSRYRQSQYRNFRVVEAGKVYRSGQMSITALQRTTEEYGIKTVICFESTKRERPLDAEEEKFCTSHGIRFVRIRPREWTADETGAIPAQQPVDQFLSVMDDKTAYPILVHCFAGMHRTGSYCAIYRMEYQGWSNVEAMTEMKDLGYTNLDKEGDVQGYLQGYIPRSKRAQR